MELNFLKNPCFIITVYVIVFFTIAIFTHRLVREHDKDGPFDEKKYIKLRAEKEQFKVMWASLGVAGALVDAVSLDLRLLGTLIVILLFAYYYRRLEEFCTRQELKKEELKLKNGKE